MYAQGVAEEKQAQFEKDKAAFASLRPRLQRAAALLGAYGCGCREGFAMVFGAITAAVDGVFDLLVTLPWKAVKPFALKAWGGVARRLKLDKRRKKPEPKAVKFLKAVREKSRAFLKKAGEFFEYHFALRVYRATAWALNPRLPSGKPLFGNETVNKIIGTGIGIGIFTAFSAAVAWVEVMAKVWHAQIGQSAFTDRAPWLVRFVKQAVLHPTLSLGLAAAQLMVIPMIAAARQGLKSTKIAQGIAYQYNSQLCAQPQAGKPAGWKPSSYLRKAFNEVAEKTAPEFYMAREKYFAAQRRKPSAPAGESPQP